MRPISDEFLLNMAAVSATVIGLFAVGILFFAETGFRRLDRAGRDVEPYIRAGTVIVFIAFALPLLLSLTLVALEPIWSIGLYAVLSLLLIAANVDTLFRLRTASRNIRSPSLVVNEILGTVGTIAIITVPWALGGLSPTREDLTWAILLAFTVAFLSVGATVLFVLDIARFEGTASEPASAQPGASPPPARPRGVAARPTRRPGTEATRAHSASPSRRRSRSRPKDPG